MQHLSEYQSSCPSSFTIRYETEVDPQPQVELRLHTEVGNDSDGQADGEHHPYVRDAALTARRSLFDRSDRIDTSATPREEEEKEEGEEEAEEAEDEEKFVCYISTKCQN